MSGVYSLRGLTQGRNQHFAVNVDTSEGDLSTIDPRQLPPELKVRSTLQGETNSRGTQSLAQSEWNQSFLWGVFALLFTQLYLMVPGVVGDPRAEPVNVMAPRLMLPPAVVGLGLPLV